MAVGCLLALNSCEHDMDKYQKKPTPSDAERVSYAEKVLGITIDKQQDWVLTKEYSVKIVADANLQDIFEVRVLNAHPYAETNAILASSAATKGNEVTLRFRSPFVADSMLYAACVTKDGKCIARPFIPGVDASVSFIDKAPNQASSRRYKAATVINPPQSTMSYIKDYYSFIRALKKALPEGNDNRTVIGGSDYTNIIQVRKNPYDTNSLLLAYLGGKSGPDDDLFYVWYPGGTTENKDSFHIIDNYPAGWITPKMSFEMQAYEVPSHYLNGRDSYGNLCTHFSQGDILDLHLMKNGNLLDDTSSRVKVYMFNGYVFVGCEDGDNWDYNDRMFWMPYGADRVEKAEGLPVPPEPSEPKVWTYVWEDKDYGDSNVVLGSNSIPASGYTINDAIDGSFSTTEADKQKTTFIQNVSHQIRTPLNIIMGFAQVLSDGSNEGLSDEETKSITDMMDHNSKHLNRMLLMLFDSSDTGLSEELNSQKQDIVPCNDVVNEAIGYTNMHYPNLHINFQTDVPDDFSIKGNRLYLMRALRELLYNSAKYSDGKNICIHVMRTENIVRFMVEDTGKNISEADSKVIFKFFAKGDDLTEGLGLGLPLAKRHAQNLGGDLILDTNYHQGCRFIIEIPY